MLGPDRGMMDSVNSLRPGTMLRAKAAETLILMGFTRREIEGQGEGLRLREPLQAATQAMTEWLDVHENADIVTTAPQHQKAMNSCRKVFLYSAETEIAFAPQRHLFAHGTCRTDCANKHL
eukprot:8224238-Pyramimonas_sp.AAC.1